MWCLKALISLALLTYLFFQSLLDIGEAVVNNVLENKYITTLFTSLCWAVSINPCCIQMTSIAPTRMYPNKGKRKRPRSRFRYCRRKTGPIIMGPYDQTTTINMSAMAVRVAAKYTKSMDHSYDTDSFQIGIDNHASYCMTNNKEDFVGGMVKAKARVKGIGGNMHSVYKGTVQWAIETDSGERVTLRIPNSYYVPGLPIRLLSPQHLAQEMARLETKKYGTSCITLVDALILTWFDHQYTRTVPLNESNVAVLRSAPVFKRLKEFEKEFESPARDLQAFQSHWIPPDDDSENDTEQTNSDDLATPSPTDDNIAPNERGTKTVSFAPTEGGSPDSVATNEGDTHLDTDKHNCVDFDLTQEELDLLERQESDEDPEVDSPTELLKLWHYRLGHAPFSRLREMAACGELSASLLTCRAPTCSACRLGKATKVPWKGKGKASKNKIKEVTAPGQCVSVDQLESTTPGFIAQLRGWLTKARYRYATVFVDHFSDLTYVHFHQRITADETVKAKTAFEAYAAHHGVKVLHYHADNGRFADKEFLASIVRERQTISFCGVNAHFQNGRAEKKIRDLQDNSRTSIIHARQRWPHAMEVHLWP